MFVILDTSRMPRPLEENGKGYWFVDRDEMEQEIAENNFLEHGEHNGNLYGTHLDSIRNVIKEGLNLTKASSLCAMIHTQSAFSSDFCAQSTHLGSQQFQISTVFF